MLDYQNLVLILPANRKMGNFGSPVSALYKCLYIALASSGVALENNPFH